jgi:hypothetical protein
MIKPEFCHGLMADGVYERSDALTAVPQFDELRMSFGFYMTKKASLTHWPWLEVIRFDYPKGSNVS